MQVCRSPIKGSSGGERDRKGRNTKAKEEERGKREGRQRGREKEEKGEGGVLQRITYLGFIKKESLIMTLKYMAISLQTIKKRSMSHIIKTIFKGSIKCKLKEVHTRICYYQKSQKIMISKRILKAARNQLHLTCEERKKETI